VQATRLFRGVSALTAVIILYAFIFDDPASLIVSVAMSGFLLSRVYLHIRGLGALASSVTLERETSAKLVRQGSPVYVTSTIGADIPPDMTVVAEDLLPPGAILAGRSARAGLVSGETVISYVMKIMMYGKVRPSGISLSTSGRWFDDEIFLKLSVFREPEYSAMSTSPFAGGKSMAGDNEIDLHTPLQGTGVISFRKFIIGDAARHIDWKVSAKYGELYIRNYSSKMGLPILVVIDLPDMDQNCDTEALAVLARHVMGVVTSESLSPGSSVLIVSGGNVVDFRPLGPESGVRSMLAGNVVASSRSGHLYHNQSYADLMRNRVNIRENSYFRNSPLSEVWDGMLVSHMPLRFESDIRRVYYSIENSEVEVFSLLEGDISHLRIIAEYTARRNLILKLKIPSGVYNERVRHKTLQIIHDSVEVLQ